MGGENDLFTEALVESGVTVSNEENSASTEEQGQQPPTEETTNEGAATSTEEQPSETQGTEGESATTEGVTNEGEPPTQEEGEAEPKSGIVDLSNTEEQPTTEAQTETNDEAPININEMFGEGFNTIEDVKAEIEYAKDLEARIDELEEQEPSYANDFIKQMNDFALKGGDPVAFAKIQGMNVDELSPKEALKLDLQQQYGLSDSEADLRINNQYTTEDWDSEEDGIDPKSIDLKMDAKAAKDRLKANQADNTLIEQKPTGISEEEWQERQNESFAQAKEADDMRMWDEKNGWAPEVDKAVDSLKSDGITVDLGNGKGFKYVYDKDEAYTKDLVGQVDQALYDSGTSRDESPELAKDILENIFWLDNKAEILKTFGDEVRSMKDDEYHKAYNNPSAIKRGDQIEKGEQTVDVEEQVNKLMGL